LEIGRLICFFSTFVRFLLNLYSISDKIGIISKSTASPLSTVLKSLTARQWSEISRKTLAHHSGFPQTERSTVRLVEELQFKAKLKPPEKFHEPARESILEEQQ
jgi:hypothetical protein